MNELRDEARFERLAQQRAHEYVAEQIRRQISLGLLAPGERLPGERELAPMFGVARKTVHRALGLLAAEGLVTSRRGRYGGTFVMDLAKPDRTADQALARVREHEDVLLEALQYRLDIEPAAAAHAAAVRSSGDLERIAAAAVAAASAETDAAFIDRDTQFHVAVARATHNRFLAEGVERTRDLLGDVLVVLPESQAWRERTIEEHSAILDALRLGDEAAARRAMAAHVAHTDRSARILLAGL